MTLDNQLCDIILLGNIVAKPEIRYKANPIVAITNFTIATHKKWFDKSSQQFKEWTSFHQVKAVGELVEQTLLHVDKGDLVLVKGYLSNNTITNKNVVTKDIISAQFIQTFPKGYSHSINQIVCSGKINSAIQLVTTENNKELAQTSILITHQQFSSSAQAFVPKQVERSLHVWGKQAIMLSENAQLGDNIVVEGSLHYSIGADKAQYIDSKTIHLFKG